jgi:hypothetical protein
MASDGKVSRGFRLCVLAMIEAYKLDIPADETERIYDVLREVAEGRLTLQDGPAELLKLIPGADSDLAETLFAQQNAILAQEREDAATILRDREDMMRPRE